MYYEEMFSQPKMNLFARNPLIIIPAYDKRFIGIRQETEGLQLKSLIHCILPSNIGLCKLTITGENNNVLL